MITNSKVESSAHIANLMLLAAIVVIWGFNWPILKMTLRDISPLWLGSLRMIIGAACILIYLMITKNFRIPTRRDIPVIFSVGFLQMAAFTAFVNIGLSHVSAGRSAILAYTTPLWVTPIAVFIFKEKLPFFKAIGLLLGLIGVFLLFNPANFDWGNRLVVIGNGFLLLSAFVWAICILHTSFTKWYLSPLQLLPWQMSIAAIVLFFSARYFEPTNSIQWSWRLIELLLYIGPLATAVGYWISIELTRRLSSVTTSLCMLSVPVVGLISSYFLLDEPIYFDMLISMAFIIAGLICVIRAKEKPDHNFISPLPLMKNLEI